MLGDHKGELMNRYVANYTLFDLETTGLSSTEDAILEISALKVRNGKVREEFSALVNPGRDIPWNVTMINHITEEMVSSEPYIDEILPRFLRFAGDDVMVGHNISSFDMRFIWRDCEKFFFRIPDNDYVDTLRYARAVLPGLSGYTLTGLASYFGIQTEGAHRALFDCHMNQQVYELLGAMMNDPRLTCTKPPICPKCGSPMVRRKGKFGDFYGCSEYPNCRQTKKLEE